MFSSSKGKTQLISLLSSIFLWFYVTTVVDPTETKTYKDIPISINSSNIIQENNLAVFPEETLTADITVKTNLSKLKKISKDNIIVYGTLSNPVSGKNLLSLSSNLPESIQHEIESKSLTINLEPYETISKEISVIANKKYTSEEYEIQIDKENVEISGTKTLINKIDTVVATIKGNDLDEDFEEKLEIIPLDINGQKVEGVKLSDKYITATITKILKEDETINSTDVDETINSNKNLNNTKKDDEQI